MELLKERGDIRENVPTRWSHFVFVCKVWGLRAGRWWQDQVQPVVCWPQERAFEPAWRTIYAERSGLWLYREGPEQAFEEGKVQNLKLACALLDGVVIEPGGVFSFWRQLGRASRGRGFQIGRMLQYGCVVPAVGGGLCQLSNALYAVALRCGYEIVERHAHSVRMKHAPVHDATVAWNYVDLRFRAREKTRIIARVEAEELVVGFATEGQGATMFSLVDLSAEENERRDTEIKSCLTCNEVGCFRHGNDGRSR